MVINSVIRRGYINAVSYTHLNGAPGMFYYYFKSKEDIFLACMETYFEEKIGRAHV